MGAKTVSISIDSGSTYRTLPGNSGEIANDAGSIDDTVFGQNFKSGQTGLITWSCKANGIYKGFAGYAAKILKSGSSTATTGEAMSVVSGRTYKTTNAAKNVWDRASTLVVYDGVTDVTVHVASINWLFGQVTFAGDYTVLGAVTADVHYLPMTQVARASEFTLNMTTNAIDDTDYETAQGNTGYRHYIYGLQMVALDLSGIYASSNGYRAALVARSELIMEINPDGSEKSVARGYFKPMSQGQSGNVGALEKETNKFELSVPAQANVTTVFSWQHASNTTLNQALQDMLTAWLAQTSTFVKYLPDGTNGVSGSGVLTDVTLKGGLEAMNEFSCNVQGCNALTAVP